MKKKILHAAAAAATTATPPSPPAGAPIPPLPPLLAPLLRLFAWFRLASFSTSSGVAPRWRSHSAAAGAARNAFALARDFSHRVVRNFAALADHLDFRGPARRGGSRLRRSRRRCKFAIARYDFSPSHQGDYRATPF